MANQGGRNSSRQATSHRAGGGSGSRKGQSRRRKMLAWSAGVLATVTAAILVTVITGAAHAVLSVVGHHRGQEPIAISPATPRGAKASSPAASRAATRRTIPHSAESYQQVENQYYLPGAIREQDLPKVPNLHRSTIPPPTTSWMIDLNALGTSTSPVVITGMSIHVISRLPAQPVTMVDSCWKHDCTPPVETLGTALVRFLVTARRGRIASKRQSSAAGDAPRRTLIEYGSPGTCTSSAWSPT